jgi:hypothetical protein
MTIFRASLLVLSTLSLVGCATILSEAKYTTVETKQKNYYEDSDPSDPKKHFISIESVSLNGSKIFLQLVDKSLYEEYSAPVITYLREVRNFIGHIEKTTTTKPSVDVTKEVKTGKSEWRNIKRYQYHKFLISGFDKDYEFTTSTNPEEYDLSPYILNTDLTNSTTLKITCLDCGLQGQQEQSLYKDIKKTVELTADFRVIKANLIKIRKESQGVPLNEFKAQCQTLGFKLGTTEYGNCVLELNETK